MLILNAKYPFPFNSFFLPERDLRILGGGSLEEVASLALQVLVEERQGIGSDNIVGPVGVELGRILGKKE